LRLRRRNPRNISAGERFVHSLSLDERSLRKLFVGSTRATMKLVLVVSERAARVLPRGAP
jgi:hypothetical protein